MHSTGAKVMFIEVNNDDEQFLVSHYRTVMQYSDDYKGVNASSVSVAICFCIFYLFFANFIFVCLCYSCLSCFVGRRLS